MLPLLAIGALPAILAALRVMAPPLLRPEAMLLEMSVAVPPLAEPVSARVPLVLLMLPDHWV